jgi:hypothetical protein
MKNTIILMMNCFHENLYTMTMKIILEKSEKLKTVLDMVKPLILMQRPVKQLEKKIIKMEY